MKRLMRLAFESDDTAAKPQASQAGEATIVMKGPLSAVFHQALAVAYAKQDTVTGEPTTVQQDNIATESQANDALMLAHLGRLAQAEPDEGNSDTKAIYTVYGVSSQQLSDPVVVDVTKELVTKPAERNFYLVIDGTQAGSNSEQASTPQENFLELEAALETMVRAHGGVCFENFKDLVTHIQAQEALDPHSASRLRAQISGDQVVDPGGDAGDAIDDNIDVAGAVGNLVHQGVDKLRGLKPTGDQD